MIRSFPGLFAVGLAACAPPERIMPQPAEVAVNEGLDDASTFVARPPLSPTAQALPRLAGRGPGDAAINADLDALDALDAANIADCKGDWNRTIAAPMTGPNYMTFLISQDYYCGGPYPTAGQTALTYDLSTGRRVDWVSAVPGLRLTTLALSEVPAGYVRTYQSAVLAGWYGAKMLAVAEGDCREVYDPQRLAQDYFVIWADADNGGVSVAPDFPHVAAACGERVTLTSEDLRRYQADARLIQAITAAKAAGNWTPRDPSQ